MPGLTIDVKVTRHEIPRFLPGYFGVVMHDEGGSEYFFHVMEIEESEETFDLNRSVTIRQAHDAHGSEILFVVWMLGGRERKQQVIRRERTLPASEVE